MLSLSFPSHYDILRMKDDVLRTISKTNPYDIHQSTDNTTIKTWTKNDQPFDYNLTILIYLSPIINNSVFEFFFSHLSVKFIHCIRKTTSFLWRRRSHACVVAENGALEFEEWFCCCSVPGRFKSSRRWWWRHYLEDYRANVTSLPLPRLVFVELFEYIRWISTGEFAC